MLKKLKIIKTSDLFIGIAAVLMFFQTFYRLATIGWKSADFTHAYFILPISLFIIWNKLGYLDSSASPENDGKVQAQVSDEEEIPLSPFFKGGSGGNISGVVLFITGVLAYVYSAINAFMFLEATSFVLVMWGIFRLRLSKESFKHFLFPLAYLIFLIPPLVLLLIRSPFH